MSIRESGWTEAGPAGVSARSRLTRRALRGVKIAAMTLGLITGSIGGYWGILQYEGNFHAVAPGILYRSAQLTGDEIRAVVREHGIRSVLNLRGAHVGDGWYDDEIATSRELNLAHFDYPLTAKRFVRREQIADLLEIIDKAPKPILVHCKSGADRSGLVAALYRYSRGASATEADRELSLVYGHFPYLTSRTGAMDDSFWAFVRSAARPGE